MSSSTHKIVMRRIYILYLLGFIFNTTAFAVLVAVVAGNAVVHVVHVGSVMSNMSQLTSTIAREQFFVSAFEHTKLITQTAVVALSVAIGYFIYSVLSNSRLMYRSITA